MVGQVLPHNVRPISGRAGTAPAPDLRELYRRPGPLHWRVMRPVEVLLPL